MTRTPEQFFSEVAASRARCFWLDGGGARAWSGRRSIIGWLDDADPDAVSLTYCARDREVRRHAGGHTTVVGDDPFHVLERELAGGSASDQWFGYFGYAARPDLPARPDPDLPDAVWMRASHVRLFEHRSPPRSGPAPTAHQGDGAGSQEPDPAYRQAFDRVQHHLHAGNSYEVNLTYRVETAGDVRPADTYLGLRELNPAPYAGFLQHDVTDVPQARAWLLSSSPERYALVSADRTIEAKPIKGTTPRSADRREDESHRADLAADPRYRAENLMITDLLRHDLSQVCQVGTVEVPVLMAVESYATVHQLVTTVRGRLRDDVTTLAALRSLFPAGSMTGAPKLRTMQIIDEVESSPRGAYAGAFGWIAGDGRADLGVIIRSLMTAGDGRYRLGTGGGITVHSDVDSEYAEAMLKADRVLRALAPDR